MTTDTNTMLITIAAIIAIVICFIYDTQNGAADTCRAYGFVTEIQIRDCTDLLRKRAHPSELLTLKRLHGIE